MNSEASHQGGERSWLVAFFSFMFAFAGTTAFLQWLFADIQQRELTRAFGNIPVPVATAFFFEHRIIFLLLPVPWFAFALYASFRGTATMRQLVGFSSSLILAVVSLFVVSAMAFSLPWFPRYVISGNAGMHLNPEQLAAALLAADREDAQANYRLFLHYAFTTHQTDLADQYLGRAAALGHSQDQAYLKLRRSSAESR